MVPDIFWRKFCIFCLLCFHFFAERKKIVHLGMNTNQHFSSTYLFSQQDSEEGKKERRIKNNFPNFFPSKISLECVWEFCQRDVFFCKSQIDSFFLRRLKSSQNLKSGCSIKILGGRFRRTKNLTSFLERAQLFLASSLHWVIKKQAPVPEVHALKQSSFYLAVINCCLRTIF